MSHKHWTVLAFNEMDGKNYVNAVEVSILTAENEREALNKAGRIIQRKNYVLRKVLECATCNLLKPQQEG